MNFKFLFLIAVLFPLSTSLFANPLADSVGVENQNGKLVIIHKLDPKDNYYSIGRRYNVKPKDIMQFNNNVLLHVGSTIKVPTERSFLQTETASKTAVQPPKQVNQPAATPQQPQAATSDNKLDQSTQVKGSNTSVATQYKVSAGETLYSIAKRFNTTVENITALNNLKTTTVSAGQILNIKTDTPAPPSIPQPPTDTPIVAKRDMTAVFPDSSSAEHRAGTNRYGLYEKDEKGVATWMDDDGLDPNKKLVLHRTAPVGTVIRITNPMSNKTTFAKVVGRFTESESTKDVILVMTKGVAQALGALDKRVHVNISYGVPNE